jgi:ABC-2 type transport system ATP-binding protein
MEPLLRVHGLTKRFPGFLLENVSFEVPRGYVMGLIGANGAGKTTTLKSILGLVRRDAGEIRIDGSDPTLDGGRARARVGFVHDQPAFPRYLKLRTVAHLVSRFYGGWNEATFRRLAGEFGLHLGKSFGSLSRGTKMKFALALALSHGADLLLLDEPTTGLDPVFRRELLDVLLELLEDERRSVLFSTHVTADLDRIADHVTMLAAGRVLFSAPKDEILDRWAIVRGGPELLGGGPTPEFRGVQPGVHGFEAITDDAAAVRRRFGDAVIIERATLEKIVLLATEGGSRA